MDEKLEVFLQQIPGVDTKSASDLIEYFVYFISVVRGDSAASSTDIHKCFDDALIHRYSNVPAYLSNHSRRKRTGHPKFIGTSGRYRLTRSRQRQIEESLTGSPAKQNTSRHLRDLIPKLTNPQEKVFLQETISCYEIGAHRAAIVMTWILAVHHLNQHILKHKLLQFNAVLATNTDKRVKLKAVTDLDDFSEIPEAKFIEFARAAKIISNDVRKILVAKLDVRNSAAHPSGITISPVKVTDFVTDLVDNVVLKYKR